MSGVALIIYGSHLYVESHFIFFMYVSRCNIARWKFPRSIRCWKLPLFYTILGSYACTLADAIVLPITILAEAPKVHDQKKDEEKTRKLNTVENFKAWVSYVSKNTHQSPGCFMFALGIPARTTPAGGGGSSFAGRRGRLLCACALVGVSVNLYLCIYVCMWVCVHVHVSL
jgi:hypothetical protein